MAGERGKEMSTACAPCPLPPPPHGPCSMLRGGSEITSTPGLKEQGCVGGRTKNTRAAGGVLLRPITEVLS